MVGFCERGDGHLEGMKAAASPTERRAAFVNAGKRELSSSGSGLCLLH